MLTTFIDTEALLSRTIPGCDIPLVPPATTSPHTNRGRCVMQRSHICPCSVANGKCCGSPVAPLSAVSGHKRYNTLHFACKVVCQQGCSAPLLDDPAWKHSAAMQSNGADGKSAPQFMKGVLLLRFFTSPHQDFLRSCTIRIQVVISAREIDVGNLFTSFEPYSESKSYCKTQDVMKI